MRRALVLLLFFLSGAAALAYQVAWTRHLVLVFGNTTRAVSLILAAYMLGLALGAEAGGRLADRSKRPVLWYAGFEAAIGAFALAFPWLVDAVRGAYLELGTAASPVLFVGAFAVLLVPTFLMGTTLPLLVRTLVADPRRTGADVGLLYGANTVGAVVGTAVTGFWLIEAAGVLGATRWAAALNVLVGLLSLAVPLLPAVARTASPTSEAAPAVEDRGRLAAAAVVAVFCGGLVGLAAEVVWTRLLIFFLQGFTYTFSAMLATFLLGLALGGFVSGRIASRTPRPAVLMGRLQLGVGVAGAGVLLLLAHHFEGTRTIWIHVGDTLGIEALRMRHVVTLLLASGVVLLVPTFLMGGVFPLAAAVFQRGLGDLGARVGRLYAVNTVGAVLGSLLAGFVLAPLAGPSWSAVVVAVGGVASGVAVLWLAGERGAPFVRWSAGGAVVALLLLMLADPTVPFLTRSHVFAGSRARENRLLETRQGTVCEVSVVRNERDDYHLLYTDEFQAAGTKPEYRYMRMLAHLPIALAEDPERALVICWGTGTTSGSVSTHPSVKELDIVEISPQVLEVAHYFDDVNRGVLDGAGRDDLDVRVHVDDGRNFVLRATETWDVISLEPLMPYTPAAIHFYTEDFYRECAPRLAPGGTMCQWIPLQGLSREHLQQLVSAFVNVFPGSAMFFVDGAVALIGGHEPLKLDHAQVARRLAAPGVREDLAAIGYDDPVRALGTLVAAGDTLAAFGAVQAMTDEHPSLEFHPIPLNVQLNYLWENVRACGELRRSYDELPVAHAASPDLSDRYDVALKVGNLLLEGMERLEEAGLLRRLGRGAAAGEALAAARRALSFAVALDPEDPAARRTFAATERVWRTIEADAQLAAGDLDGAERTLRRALTYEAEIKRDVVPTLLAEVLSRQERFEEALQLADDATRLHPLGLEPRAERAYARGALGDAAGAARDYRRALDGDPVSTLAPRLRADADRVLSVEHPPESRTVAERIEAALSGERVARVPPRLELSMLATDHPVAYAAHFAPDVETLRTETDTGDRMLALKRLQLGAPPAASAVLRDVAVGSGEPSLRRAAAGALGDVDPAVLPVIIDAGEGSAESVIAAAEAAARVALDAAGPALLARLQDRREEVRRAAKRALFALSDGESALLASLDVQAHGSAEYDEAVEAISAWWRSTR
jgi:predicted membrane-bound spermidine synthase/tetratricopeptide (TPR) repeat protein